MRNAAVGTGRRLARLIAGLKNRSSSTASTLGLSGIGRLRATRIRLASTLRPVDDRSAPPRPGDRPSRGRHVSGQGAHPVGRPSTVPSLHQTLTEIRRSPFASIRRLAALGFPRERVIPIGVAALVLAASAFSVAGGAAANGGTGSTHAGGTTPRIAIGGSTGSVGAPNQASGFSYGPGPAATAIDPGLPSGSGAPFTPADPSLAPQVGPFLADGTLLMPVAVNTIVPDGSSKLVSYTVRSGDTLTGIANRFGVSMMSIWWANKLTSKDQLHLGQTLVIPPVSGLVVTVASGDTLAAIASRTGVSASEILSYNGLTDSNLVIGQKLIIPGAVGKAIPTPKPVAQAAVRTSGGGGVVVYHSAPASYAGGRFAWPVPGGYISQYFWSGHLAIDIAASYGSPIEAAAPGVVIFAGWKNDGGGYQVWLSHGSGLYTAYYHMSAFTVAIGERVGRGSQIGRIGMTGMATGPHCHFEVWIGYPWESGSYRVNPLGYL
ncbi:MAG: M23 family metallopeptidase [Candidatus Limnocylindrales bacterium]